MQRTSFTAVTTVLTLVVVTGCSPAVDKAGGDTVVLEFAVIDHVDAASPYVGPATFVEELASVSGGRLSVDVLDEWGDGAHEAEADIISAVASGDLAGGFVSVRAFPAAGFDEFAALQAPFVLTSYAAQADFVVGAKAADLLSGLEDSGVVGLAMTVGALRRPFGVDEPLRELDDWTGNIRVFNSQVQADAVAALGATPVEISYGWADRARAGDLRGVEFDVSGYAAAGFTTEAANLTSNVVLWPKIDVIILGAEAWGELSEEQRGWMSDAAARAVQASTDAPYDDSALAARLCAKGVRLFELTDEQIDAWHRAVAPVVASLEESSATADVLAAMREAAAGHRVDVLAVPEGCAGTAPVSSKSPMVPADTTAPIPDGAYRVDVTQDALDAAGESSGPGWTGTWTLTIADGTYALACSVIAAPGKDCGNVTYGDGFPEGSVLEAGQLRGDDTVVTLVYDAGLHSARSGCDPCQPLPDQTYTWRITDDELILGPVVGGHSAPSLTIAPLLRIP